MLMSPSMFQANCNSNSEWLLDNLIESHDHLPRPVEVNHSSIYRFSDASAGLSSQPIFSHLIYPSDDQPQQLTMSPVTAPCKAPLSCGDDSTMLNKLNHRVRERDRRKKLNDLYSSLRSLLPAAPHMKHQQSIPATVSRILKYIPELKQQVERLLQEKESLLSKVCRETVVHSDHDQKIRQRQLVECKRSNGTAVSVSRLNEKEVCLQISHKRNPEMLHLSEVISALEKDGYFLIYASSFETFEGRVCYSLHVQDGRIRQVECEVLREKMLSLGNAAAASSSNNYSGRCFNF